MMKSCPLFSGCFTVWTTGNWQDFTRPSCGPSYRVYLYQSVRFRTCTEIYWRRIQDGTRIIRHG
jgi:hypothetical protein